jgi:hypothetical protein
LEWVLSFIKVDPQIQQILVKLLQQLLEYKTTDPLLNTRYIGCLGALNPLYKYNEKALDATLQRLFVEMQFKLPSEQNVSVDNISEDSVAARKKAFSTFITLCKTHAKYLLPNLKALVDKSEELWSKNQMTSSEMIYMYEAFVVISKELPSQEAQAQLLAYLLQKPKSDWQSQTISQVVGDPALVLKMVGILPEPNQQQFQALQEMRRKISHILNLFVAVTKRVPEPSAKNNNPSPVAAYLLEMIPNVMSLIRTLHGLYIPNIQNMIDEHNRIHLFHIGLDEEARLMGKPFIASTLSDTERRVFIISRTLRHLRLYAYQILGYACAHCDFNQFWNNPQLFQLLTNSVFSYLDVMDNKDVKSLLLHFLHPFVTKCPSQLYDSLLSQVLIPFYSAMHKRIDQSWNTSINRERPANASDELLRLDVIQDKIVTELTREVLTLPTDVTQCLHKSKEHPNPKPNELCTYIMKNENIMGMWLLIAIRTLAIPDTLSSMFILSTNNLVQKSITFIQRVLPYLSKNNKFDVLFAGDMLQMALQSLMVHKADVHQNLISLITDLYVIYVQRSTSLPKQIFLQLPGVTENKLSQLNQGLKGQGVAASNNADKQPTPSQWKKIKALMKKFLDPVSGKASGEFRKTASIVKIQSGSGQNKGKGKNNTPSFLDDVSVNIEFIGKLFK